MQIRAKKYTKMDSPPPEEKNEQSRRPTMTTTTTDPSFENMVNAATGGEPFNTSMSTIGTTQKKEDTSRKVRRPADPEGTIFTDTYAAFYNTETHQFEPVNGSQHSNSPGSHTTCPTDSHSFDSYQMVARKEEGPEKLDYEQHRVAMKNRATRTSDDAASTTSTVKESSCRNCTSWLLCLATILIIMALSGTAVVVYNIYAPSEQVSVSGVNGEEKDVLTDDWVESTQEGTLTYAPLPSMYPTGSPTQEPTQNPSLRPSNFPSVAPSIRVTTAPTFVPTTRVPTVAPTMAPSTQEPSDIPSSTPVSIGPTPLPSFAPTDLPSGVPTSAPTFAPTRPAVDLSDSPFLAFLQEVVEFPDDLLDVNTPQGRALEWLEHEDKVDLEILELGADTSAEEKTKMLTDLYQRFALVTLDFALRNTLDLTNWSFPRLHVCVWTGVKCNSDHEVNRINWAGQNLTGTIANELGLLTNLKSLDIAQNHLKGSLDPLYKLTEVKDIFVFENQISGRLTRGLENCRSLERIMAGFNQLTGTLPSLQMKDLLWFNVQHNQITGTIPPMLALDFVKIFDISNNQIGGSIPANFVETVVPNIRHLYIGNNKINGTVPEDFVNLGKGRVLQIFMNDNQLVGGFPTRFETIKHLTNLDLSNNLFTARLGKMCGMSVFEYGELVEMRADCRICNCNRICRTCHDNIDHLYEYDDDEWLFDDDTLFDDDEADDDDDDADDDDGDEDVEFEFNQGREENADDDDRPVPIPVPQPQPEPQFQVNREDDDDNENNDRPVLRPAPQAQHQPNNREEDDDDDDWRQTFIVVEGSVAMFHENTQGKEGDEFDWGDDGDDFVFVDGQD